MKLTVGEIAKLVDGRVEGDAGIVIGGVASLKEATVKDITFLAHPKYSDELKLTNAGAILTKDNTKLEGKTTIVVKDPSLAFSRIAGLVAIEKFRGPSDIHHTAVISTKARLGSNVRIGAGTIIEDGAVIGDDVIIFPQCYVGYGTKVGNKCLIYPQVVLREDVQIGDRCILHPGTVIGADGYGFVTDGEGHHKTPQLGIVVIGDDVEIGANVTVDRGTTGATVVGSGTKIDNMVHIAHNVQVGLNCLIVAQVGIAGSSRIGNWVTLGGQAGIAGHIEIGDKAMVAARSGVTKDVPANTVVSGYPARPHREELKIEALIGKLPELFGEKQFTENRRQRAENREKN